MVQKGDAPYTYNTLCAKLSLLWKALDRLFLTPNCKGFYVFSFYSIEDLHQLLAVGSWSFELVVLGLFGWTSNFNLDTVKTQ